ncbi:carbohydrate-binding module family 5 protein [Plicaturopsis crispa FD-325 SS-3]|nr:carbohydrate-binding module family 5 protein [Plicaturopsis crispa FD-325 SS-3]
MSPSFRNAALLVASLLASLVLVQGTQVMQRPADYKSPARVYSMEKTVHPHTIQKRDTGKVQAAYFTNWGIYGANFQPQNITPSDLTHILYAFADVSASTGVISLTDSYADEQKHYDGDSWDEPGNNLYGCLKQMYLLKLANRNLKVLLSIGGWTYSQENHFDFVTDASLRSAFITSAVQLIEDYGFDGIDIDFEYPSTTNAQGFADLLTDLRTAFDNLQTKKGDKTPYQLTAAVSAGYNNSENLVFGQMDKALTYWNLMAYDYAGSWLTFADNQANLYGGVRTNVSTDKAIKFFTANGATIGKINMGIPLYGRAFEETDGLGDAYTGIGPGTIQAGVYSYNTLPLSGSQVYENTTDVSSYSYDSAKKELVSYDTPNIVTLKAKYVQANDLAGSMYWDLSTDKVGADSLVGTVSGVYGSLDQTQNHISYPNSKWDNIRDNMNGSSTSTTSSSGSSSTTAASSSTSVPASTTAAPTSSTASTSGSAPATTTASGSSCSSASAWSSSVSFICSTAYTGGSTVTYNGNLWTASWWTEGDTPGGAAGVWVEGAAC